ncbi:MAG: DUF169 domain-containing protein [Planctomycetota bacterium]
MAKNHRLQELLALEHPPVGVAFLDKRPLALARMTATAPSGCTFWQRAAEGAAFYTEATDHFGCPVGAHTHNVDLPPAKHEELAGLVQTMVGLSYLTTDEVARLPRRKREFRFAAYYPLTAADLPTDLEPEVVLVRGGARQLMLLNETLMALGLESKSGALGRPTCGMIPDVIESGLGALSLGCIGNRVYTGLGDNEAYMALPGAALAQITERLATIVAANHSLAEFHAARR